MNKNDTDIVGWMTVNGNHIPIHKGQTREQAMLTFLSDAEGGEPFAKKPENKTLSKKEFAVWYQKIGEIKRGGYVDKMSNGDKLIPIDNKIVITSGTYDKPKLNRVLNFPSEEDMFEGLQALKED